ncbi:membrane protease YdiL (CAAX protease family) [Caulobacter ginsengisoli]|uniref:Membrane protease YdiL (CAAX protease family) n=1 Tax=Caulobacter ginsengisoli TaxID=400775 RepID=A0ABU0IN24_9CAUL|nr:CPBP family glutamic-type intramembrane protease [Caulobacter ginsengisoli]MDQ0463413.1 membrane protease YdiL (CAAX protease family) [Caulobacter ginsengisoli]
MDKTPTRAVLAFFALTIALTAPFWVVSAVSAAQLMPGLPLAGLAVACPAAAGLILAWRRGGAAGGRALLGRVFDGGQVRSLAGWLALVLTAPAVAAAAFLILRMGGSAVPDPAFSLTGTAALFGVFLLGGLLEELGWTGFALEALKSRGPLAAGLIIGAVWAAWHYPALLQAHRSLAWIGWWTLWTMSLRLIMVRLYGLAGPSVFGMAVFHAMTNLSWQLFPVQGSWFDPRLNGLLMAGVAIALIAMRASPAPPPHAPRTTPSPGG